MPESWTAVTWGEVAKKEIFKVATTSLVEKRVAGVLNAGRGMFDRGPVEEFDTNYEFFHEVRAGQLVVRKLTAWEGPVTVVTPEFDGHVCSPEFPTFTLDADRLAPSYARLLCQRPDFWSQILAVSTGSVLRRKRVSPAALLSLPIVLPPIEEQWRIVDLVGSIDASIDNLETQVDTTRTARSALLSELLSNPGDDWQETTLGEAFDIRMGRQRSPKNASGTHMVSYLRAANVKDGELLLGDVKQMNFSPEEQATFRLEPGDVLVTEGCGSREEVGASAQWNSEIAGAVCFQNTLLRMRRVDGITSSGFAEVVARYFYSNGRWADVASGTNIFHIGANRAVAMPFDLPPLADQQRIVDLVGSFDEQISSLESQVESVRALRSGVLSELLSGERLLDESYDMAVGL